MNYFYFFILLTLFSLFNYLESFSFSSSSYSRPSSLRFNSRIYSVKTLSKCEPCNLYFDLEASTSSPPPPRVCSGCFKPLVVRVPVDLNTHCLKPSKRRYNPSSAPSSSPSSRFFHIKNELFLAGLPFSYTEDDLNQLFARFGVISSTIIKGEDEKSKGFGFVELESEEVLSQAIEEMNGVIFPNGKPLHVDRVSKKGKARDSESD